MKAGYSPAMFNDFVVKGKKMYELVYLQAYSDTAD